MSHGDRTSPVAGKRIEKLLGADIELGNFVAGTAARDGSGREASRAILQQIPGIAARSVAYAPASDHASAWYSGYAAYAVDDGPHDGRERDARDLGRKFLPANGGCAYIDLDHLELCLPEVRSSRDFVASWHAMLRIAQQALERANRGLPSGEKVHAFVNNSDGDGHSWGGHINVLMTRRGWDNLFKRKMHYLLYLATFQASSVVWSGSGKVGSENGRPPIGFQLSTRADFLECLTGEQTTFNRPIVNSRDEPLCGDSSIERLYRSRGGEGRARLHVIFFDSGLCHVSTLLKAGTMQLITAMIEAERIDPDLVAEDPVDAVIRFSRDLSLGARARTIRGAPLTALEFQEGFLAGARRFAEQGGFDGVVPGYEEILEIWEDTLGRLESRDLATLAGSIDWVRKYMAIRRAMELRRGLRWDSAEVKRLDLAYGSLDPEEGLYWAFESAGLVDRVVPEERIDRLTLEPPDDTRAWARASLLRLAGEDEFEVEEVAWDRLEFRSGWGFDARTRTVRMDDPLGFTREALSPALDGCGCLSEALDAMGITIERPGAPDPSGGDETAERAPERVTGFDERHPCRRIRPS